MNRCIAHSLYEKYETIHISMSKFDEEVLHFESPNVIIVLDNDILSDIMKIDNHVMNIFNKIYKTTLIDKEYLCTDMLLERWEMCPTHKHDHECVFYNRLTQDMVFSDELTFHYKIDRLLYPHDTQCIVDVFKHVCSCVPINAADIYTEENFYFNTPSVLHFQKVPYEKICDFDSLPSQMLRVNKHNKIYYKDLSKCVHQNYEEVGIDNKETSNRRRLLCLLKRYLQTKDSSLFEKYHFTTKPFFWARDNNYVPCVDDMEKWDITKEDEEDFDLLVHPAYLRHYKKYIEDESKRVWGEE